MEKVKGKQKVNNKSLKIPHNRVKGAPFNISAPKKEAKSPRLIIQFENAYEREIVMGNWDSLTAWASSMCTLISETQKKVSLSQEEWIFNFTHLWWRKRTICLLWERESHVLPNLLANYPSWRANKWSWIFFPLWKRL